MPSTTNKITWSTTVDRRQEQNGKAKQEKKAHDAYRKETTPKTLTLEAHYGKFAPTNSSQAK